MVEAVSQTVLDYLAQFLSHTVKVRQLALTKTEVLQKMDRAEPDIQDSRTHDAESVKKV